MKIIPAILTSDPDALKRMINQAEAFTDYVQVDIVDGKFVDKPTSITAHDLARIRTSLQMEAHLMVIDPDKYVEAFKRAGVRKIVFHCEETASPSPKRVVEEIRALGLEVGVAISPETPLSKLEGLSDTVDSVLFLSVHPGSQNQKFIPQVLGKVSELRNKKPSLETGLDGGIKLSNIKKVAESGVDFVCVGSGIFGQGDSKKNFFDFQSCLVGGI